MARLIIIITLCIIIACIVYVIYAKNDHNNRQRTIIFYALLALSLLIMGGLSFWVLDGLGSVSTEGYIAPYINENGDIVNPS